MASSDSDDAILYSYAHLPIQLQEDKIRANLIDPSVPDKVKRWLRRSLRGIIKAKRARQTHKKPSPGNAAPYLAVHKSAPWMC